MCVDTLGISRFIADSIKMKAYLPVLKWYWIYDKICWAALLGYNLYLDNWYSSPQLFCTLLQNKTHTIGTVRLNRKHMPSNFPWTKMKKADHVFKTANDVMALIWKDLKDEKMLSTCHTSQMALTGKHHAFGNPII